MQVRGKQRLHSARVPELILILEGSGVGGLLGYLY